MPFIHKRVGALPGGFGESLRELRELRGYSREDLSRASGIHVSTIQAFEEERIEDLLDPFYEEKHVRAILELLEGRPAYFLEKYHVMLAARGASRGKDILLRPRVRARDLFVSSRAVAFVGFLALVVLIGGYVAWQVKGLLAEPRLIVLSPQEGAVTDEPRITVKGQTDPTAAISVNGERAVVDRAGNFSLVINIPRGATTVRIEAKRRYGSMSVVERHIMHKRETAQPATSTSIGG